MGITGRVGDSCTEAGRGNPIFLPSEPPTSAESVDGKRSLHRNLRQAEQSPGRLRTLTNDAGGARHVRSPRESTDVETLRAQDSDDEPEWVANGISGPLADPA